MKILYKPAGYNEKYERFQAPWISIRDPRLIEKSTAYEEEFEKEYPTLTLVATDGWYEIGVKNEYVCVPHRVEHELMTAALKIIKETESKEFEEMRQMYEALNSQLYPALNSISSEIKVEEV